MSAAKGLVQAPAQDDPLSLLGDTRRADWPSATRSKTSSRR